MVLFLVPLFGQLRPSTPETAVVDGISSLLSQPGVYLDSLTATPRLVRVNPVLAKEIDVRVKRDEEPVVAQYSLSASRNLNTALAMANGSE